MGPDSADRILVRTRRSRDRGRGSGWRAPCAYARGSACSSSRASTARSPPRSGTRNCPERLGRAAFDLVRPPNVRPPTPRLDGGTTGGRRVCTASTPSSTARRRAQSRSCTRTYDRCAIRRSRLGDRRSWGLVVVWRSLADGLQPTRVMAATAPRKTGAACARHARDCVSIAICCTLSGCGTRARCDRWSNCPLPSPSWRSRVR
jgi:hypothetical protein